MRLKTIVLLLVSSLAYSGGWAQQTPLPKTTLRLQVREDMLHLKAKGLKKEQIYSASKKLEDFANATVSATVISQKMLE